MSTVSIASLLRGPGVVKRKANTTHDWIEIVRRGLPAMAIEAVARAVQLTQAELGETLAIPERTLLRRKLAQGTQPGIRPRQSVIAA